MGESTMDSCHCLLVDDDPQWLRLLSRRLQQAGYRPVTASQGQAAWELFAAGDFTIVITDLNMPVVNGIELLRRIKASPKGETCDVLVLTGQNDLTHAIEALRGGAFDYLQKPVSWDELDIALSRVRERQRLKAENTVFRQRITTLHRDNQQLEAYRLEFERLHGPENIVVHSPDLQRSLDLAMVFHRDRTVPVLIQGDTGTGKEIIAKLIHYGTGKLAPGPFIVVNCAAISPQLFESELFGYARGAFTGANPKGQAGKFELAQGGTLFLDEIGEMPLEFQPKLLRAVAEREVCRIGTGETIPLDVRIIAATNRDLAREMQAGRFRQDLYYRLNVGTIQLKPLREEPERIEPLALQFLKEFSAQRGKHFVQIEPAALSLLRQYAWFGNVRELRNVIDRVVLLSDDDTLRVSQVRFLQASAPAAMPPPAPALDLRQLVLPPEGLDLEALEREIVDQAMRRNRGNQSQAAHFLKISRSKLMTRLQRPGRPSDVPVAR